MWHNSAIDEHKWALAFGVFLMLTLVMDKTLMTAYYFCEGRIKNYDGKPDLERRQFQKLLELMQTQLFERCKEIFHNKFKTRKAGKESCNPIRDGRGAWRGKRVGDGIETFVQQLQEVIKEFGKGPGGNSKIFKLTRAESEVKACRRPSATLSPRLDGEPYVNGGRLACIFLNDFLDR